VLADPTREKIRRVMNVVYRRGQKSRMLPMTGEGNPVAFVTQSSKSNYKAVIVSPEQAFRIMMELEDPYRTLVCLVAVTGLRISEAVGLKWGDLDYERQMIRLHRVWVGKDIVHQLKTDGSAAPVPLGDLVADALRRWNQNSPYTKSDDWVFPSLKLKGKTPLSASIMAADKIRPAAIKVGIRLKAGQRFSFHNFRHSLATFLVSRGKDVKTIQGLLRHAKASTTLDL
jgi:integrase